jgi:hypothetical protein
LWYTADEAFPRYGYGHKTDWLSRAENLAAWLSSERFRSDEREKANIDIEAIGDSYMDRAYERLFQTAQDLHHDHSQIDTREWFFHLYCEWVLQVLGEFDNMMSDEPLRGTEFQQVYHENLRRFQTLRAAFQRERTTQDRRRIPKEAISEADALLKTTAGQLAVVWRRTVEDAVETELSVRS